MLLNQTLYKVVVQLISFHLSIVLLFLQTSCKLQKQKASREIGLRDTPLGKGTKLDRVLIQHGIM